MHQQVSGIKYSWLHLKNIFFVVFTLLIERVLAVTCKTPFQPVIFIQPISNILILTAITSTTQALFTVII